MRIEADRAQVDTQMTTKHINVTTDNQQKCVNRDKSTSSTTADPDGELQISVLSPPVFLSQAGHQKSSDEGGKVSESNFHGMVDREINNDCITSTSIASTPDQLISDMQNLRLRLGSMEECSESLVSRGPTGGTNARWNSSAQFTTSVENAQNYVPFQPRNDGERWTSWYQPQQGLQTTKLRRSGNDPQETDERHFQPLTISSTSTSEISQYFDLGTIGLLCNPDPVTECRPEIGQEMLPWMDGHNSVPPQPGIDEFDPLDLLDQSEQIGSPLLNWLMDPNAEMTSQRCHEDESHVTVTPAAVISDATTHPTTITSLDVYSGSTMSNPPDHYATSTTVLQFDLSPSWSASAPSPSVDSGFVASPITPVTPVDSLFNGHHQQQLSSDEIFDFVETKLRELGKQTTMNKDAGSRQVRLEHSLSVDSVESRPPNYSVMQQTQGSHVVQTRDPAYSIASTGKVAVVDNVSVERRRMTRASRNIAELTRDQLMIIDSSGDTVLHMALRKSEYLTEALIYRLDREQLTAWFVNQRNAFSSETPLWLATLANKPKLVRLLVERGATINAQVYEVGSRVTGAHCAVVHLASSYGLPYLDTLAELLESPGIDLTLIDSQGRTAMHRAVETHGQPVPMAGTDLPVFNDSTEIIRLLMQYGANISEPVY